MSKNFEVQGIIHSIGETTEYGNNGFVKREFVIKLTGEGESDNYPNHAALELIKDKCGIMDAYNVGDEIKVQFNLSGRLWSPAGKQEKCFTSLQAWKVEPASADTQASPSTVYDNGYSTPSASDGGFDDIPF